MRVHNRVLFMPFLN